MKRTAQLLALAEAAQNEEYPYNSRMDAFNRACIPEEIKQLVKSTVMLKDALSAIARGCNSGDPASIIARDALEAFNKWEGK